jgi:hypothetical protein
MRAAKKDRIYPEEFLFLACNAKNRIEEVQRLPTNTIDLNKDDETETYYLDQCFKNIHAPDVWINKIHNKLKFVKFIWEFEDH